MSPSAPPDRPSSEPYRSGVLLAVVYVFLLFGFYRVLGSNELTTLPIARSLVDDVYVRDWFYSSPPLPRLPFAALIAPLTLVWPLPVVALVGRLLGWTALAWTLSRVWRHIQLPAWLWIPVLAIFFALGQSLFAGEWLFRHIESKVLAYAAVFLGLSLVLERRWFSAGLGFGGAISAHALVGGWSAVALGAALVRDRAGLDANLRRLAAGTLFGGLVGVAVAARILLEPPSAPGGVDPLWVYVHFRNPHHLDPLSFDWNPVRVSGTVLVSLVVLHRAIRARHLANRFVATFAAASMAIAGVGLLLPFVPEGERLLRFYPFRVGPSAGLLLAISLMGADFAAVARSRGPRWLREGKGLPWVVTALLVLAAVPTFVQRLSRFAAHPSGAAVGPSEVTGPFCDVSRWLRENTPKDTMLIASPRYIQFAVLSERSMPVSFKGVPAGKAGLVEWYRRIVAFNGGREPEARGFRVSNEVDARFNRLSASAYRGLAEAYGGDVLLVPKRPDLELPLLYANDVWGVYALTSTTVSGG